MRCQRLSNHESALVECCDNSVCCSASLKRERVILTDVMVWAVAWLWHCYTQYYRYLLVFQSRLHAHQEQTKIQRSRVDEEQQLQSQRLQQTSSKCSTGGSLQYEQAVQNPKSVSNGSIQNTGYGAEVRSPTGRASRNINNLRKSENHQKLTSADQPVAMRNPKNGIAPNHSPVLHRKAEENTEDGRRSVGVVSPPFVDMRGSPLSGNVSLSAGFTSSGHAGSPLHSNYLSHRMPSSPTSGISSSYGPTISTVGPVNSGYSNSDPAENMAYSGFLNGHLHQMEEQPERKTTPMDSSVGPAPFDFEKGLMELENLLKYESDQHLPPADHASDRTSRVST